MFSKDVLLKKYIKERKSVRVIAKELKCSENKINYWLHKYRIKKRTISEALYSHKNPSGDPFQYKKPKNKEQHFLYGLGLGLYWGEGNKANTTSVRLGNTDPDLCKKFLEFLYEIYTIDKDRLSFGIQIFPDISKEEALQFWVNKLNVKKEQFHKPTLTPSVKKGTYGNKSKYGVLTIYFSNTKLRGNIVSAIDKLRTTK